MATLPEPAGRLCAGCSVGAVTKRTREKPQPDRLEALFHELRRSRKGGQRPPRAIWLPVVLLMTLGGLGVVAAGAYYGGTHLLGLNEDEEVPDPSSRVTLEDLGLAPEIGEMAEWAIVDSGYEPTGRVIVLQVWTDPACPGCVAHARLLNKAHFETDRAFDPLWVFSTADPDGFAAATDLAADAGVDWAVGWDPSGRVASAFPGDAAVATYIIDQDGALRYAKDGAPEDVVLNRLVYELAGAPPVLEESAP